MDLCSVAKELVENSIDAGSTNIEVRFKNQGLDSIEVQDNGSGISSQNYASIALKHYTSKLSNYDDLSTLQTFGFRGEALSSLSALSRLSIVTCTQPEAPRATRLEFETSGKLKCTSVISGQKGTTVIVEDVFRALPVRRRELERNIKREWAKVINLLNQYACVQTGIKFTVSQQPTKGKRMVMFSTKGNPTTRDNIINVFGARTMNALITLDLKLQMTPTIGPVKKGKSVDHGTTIEVRIVGHVSQPSHGDGRQAPDRQMFYVNGRPCSLPQFAKVFNEVYRLYNASQSPFIFADIQLDTHLYDVNVSPDKRTILLHDQGQMLDNLREALIELFETQDVTIPVAQSQVQKLPPFKKVHPARDETPASAGDSDPSQCSAKATVLKRRVAARNMEDEASEKDVEDEDKEDEEDEDDEENHAKKDDEDNKTVVVKVSSPKRRHRPMILVRPPAADAETSSLLSRWLGKKSETRVEPRCTTSASHTSKTTRQSAEESHSPPGSPERVQAIEEHSEEEPLPKANSTEAEAGVRPGERPIAAIPPPSQPPVPISTILSPSRPFKRPQEVATIIIGDHTVTGVVGTPSKRFKTSTSFPPTSSLLSGSEGKRTVPLPSFGGRLSQLFSAAQDSEHESSDSHGAAPKNFAPPPDEVGAESNDENRESEADEEQELEGGDEGDEDGGSLFVSQPEEKYEGIEDGNTAERTGDGPLFQVRSSSAVTNNELDNNATSPEQSAAGSPVSAFSEGDESGEGSGDDDDDDEEEEEEEEYVDEEERKVREDNKLQELIGKLETKAATMKQTEEGEKRSKALMRGGTRRKDSTLNLLQRVRVDKSTLAKRIAHWDSRRPPSIPPKTDDEPSGLDAKDAEEKLSLKITKSDFGKMRIVGQFNLGFILAVRGATLPKTESESGEAPTAGSKQNDNDELFIIDQHASDEKYNFERLQTSTVVQSQRLVQPKSLELTAVEEEILIEHTAALERNGFVVGVDQSGDKAVGSRCQLLSLPISREITFSVADLEELIFLLGDNPSGRATTVPRPSKVRKMLAMRACRSSIMIGRALSQRQMERVVRHMGEMEKPWNCPHGRPTMRHLCGLDLWDGRSWNEGDGFCDGGEGRQTDWRAWLGGMEG